MQFYIRVSVIMVSMLLFHTHTEAYQTLTLLPANPSYPDKCYEEDTNAAHAVGETWNVPGICEQYRCQTGEDNQFRILTTGCGVMLADPPCRVESGNPADPYPACCHKVVCN